MGTIPHGWALCDGSNGTPDLRNRFLEGQGWYSIGTYLNPGLPNITATVTSSDEIFESATGAAYLSGRDGDTGSSQSAYDNSAFSFNAARCSPIYGSSDTVQPAAYVVYYIIRLK